MRERFGAFYEGLNEKRGKKILFHPVFYLVRRIGMAWLVIQESITPLIFQLLIVFGLSFTVMITPNMIESHKKKSQARFFNLTEMVFLSTAYFFLIFNVVSVEDNFTLGYAPILIFGVYMSYVLADVIIGIIKNARKSCRNYMIKR